MRAVPRLVGLALMVLWLAACAGAPEPVQQGRTGMDRTSPIRAAEIHTRLGVGYLARGELQIAMENLETALRHDPRHTPAHVTLASIYERLGNARQAENHFRQADRLAPNDGATQNAYAVFLCRDGRFDEAQRRFEIAFEDPFYTTPEVAFSNAGACALRNNRPDRAETYLRQAIDLAPEFPDPLFRLAELYHDRGEMLRARAFMQRYESVAQTAPASLKLGFMIETALNNQYDAERYASRLESSFPDSTEARDVRGIRRSDER